MVSRMPGREDDSELLRLNEDGGSARTERVSWGGRDLSLVERGVCQNWCELLFRGPSASISRYGLRTRGIATWVFRQPRRDHVDCDAARGGRCSRSRRQFPR